MFQPMFVVALGVGARAAEGPGQTSIRLKPYLSGPAVLRLFILLNGSLKRYPEQTPHCLVFGANMVFEAEIMGAFCLISLMFSYL